MIPLMTAHKDKSLHLDSRMVAKVDGKWYEDGLYVWRKLKRAPRIDWDFTQRWFGYSKETMKRARLEAR